MAIPAADADKAAGSLRSQRSSAQQQRLRAFLTWLTVLAVLFGGLEFVAYSIFGESAFGIASVASAGCGIAFMLARRRLQQGRLRRAALIVYAAILAAALIGGIILPAALPMIVLLPLLALAIVLPYVWGRALYGLILAAWLVILAAAILAEFEPILPSLPHWAVGTFRAGALGAVSALLLVLLVQFSTWLTDLLGQTERANTALLDMQAELTETLRAREAAAERVSRLQAVTVAFSEALTRAQVARVVLDQGIAALGAYAGAVVVRDPERDELETIAADYAPDTLGLWQRFAASAPMPIARTIATGEPIWLETRQALREVFPAADGTPSSGAWATLPLTVDGQTNGGLAFSFATERAFGADERAFMLALARQCAQALERARLYDAEQQAHAAAREAVRVRDVLLSVASHELRNPLTSMIGFTDVLMRRGRLGEPLTEHDQRSLATIAQQAQRLDQMLTALLDMSRLTSGQLRIERQRIDIIEIAEQLIEEFLPAPATPTITLDRPAAPLIVAGDQLRLRQVFSNLLGNAMKYNRAGRAIAVRLKQRDAYACIEIADQGIGIPRAEVPNLFRLFYRASNVSEQPIEGVGIGLAVVKEIVSQHGGTIEVASSEGQGSTFTVCLPLAS